jgi:hypothetical protein
VKRCRIVFDPLRNWPQGFADAAMLGSCGLHNLRREMRAVLEPIPVGMLRAM